MLRGSDGLLFDVTPTAVAASDTTMSTETVSSSSVALTVAVTADVGVNVVEAAPPLVGFMGGATLPPLALNETIAPAGTPMNGNASGANEIAHITWP